VSIRSQLEAMQVQYDLPPLTEEQWAKHRAATHLRVAENVTLCQQSGEMPQWRVLGEWLTDDRNEVGCPTCLEWMHA
jgi:hypothetical protein